MLAEKLREAGVMAAQDMLPGNGGPLALSGSDDSIQVWHVLTK